MKRVAAALLLLPGAAAACPGLSASDAWIREAPPGADVMAGFVTLVNAGVQPLQVDGVAAAGFATATVHTTVIEDGVARMRHAGAIALQPGQRLRLEPGGMHIMLMQPMRALKAGDGVEVTFECGAAQVVVPFTVRAARS